MKREIYFESDKIYTIQTVHDIPLGEEVLIVDISCDEAVFLSGTLSNISSAKLNQDNKPYFSVRLINADGKGITGDVEWIVDDKIQVYHVTLKSELTASINILTDL